MNLLAIFHSNGDKFYKWFEEAAENDYKAALLLEKMCKNVKNSKKLLNQIDQLEKKGDEISHNIHNEINSVFVTPLDREDIIGLTKALDDVIDLINDSASSIITYNVKKINPVAKELSRVIVSSTKAVNEVLPKLKRRKNFSQIHKTIIEINRLENEADSLLRKGLTELFKKPKKPIDVIRWRDIYELMEKTTDKTEDIANVLQNLITKYA